MQPHQKRTSGTRSSTLYNQLKAIKCRTDLDINLLLRAKEMDKKKKT